MTDSNNTHNNSFIPVLFLLVSAIVIIATFYEGEAKKILAGTDNSQTESVVQADLHDSDQSSSNQADSTSEDASDETTTQNTATEHNSELNASTDTENAPTPQAAADTENLQTEAVSKDATESSEIKTPEIKIAQADTAMVTGGNGNNSANGSIAHDTVVTDTNHQAQSNEENAVVSTPVNTETENKTAAFATKDTHLGTAVNVAQNTVSNTAATQQNTAQRMPMPAHTYNAPHNTMHNATHNPQARPTNMSAATTNQYTQGYAPRYTQRYTPGYTPGPGYQNMKTQQPTAYNPSRQQSAQPRMSMAQHKEASMAYQAKMEQRRHEMMKVMEAQRLENNARIQAQLKNQAKFLAEMKQMQKIAFQRAEENRRRTMQKIQEINQRYRQLQHQVNKLNTESKATAAGDVDTNLAQ